MDKGKTPMDLYQQEVGSPKPQTKDDVEARFDELLQSKDDDFLTGRVMSNNVFDNR